MPPKRAPRIIIEARTDREARDAGVARDNGGVRDDRGARDDREARDEREDRDRGEARDIREAMDMDEAREESRELREIRDIGGVRDRTRNTARGNRERTRNNARQNIVTVDEYNLKDIIIDKILNFCKSIRIIRLQCLVIALVFLTLLKVINFTKDIFTNAACSVCEKRNLVSMNNKPSRHPSQRKYTEYQESAYRDN